jgi:hypothetical protein
MTDEITKPTGESIVPERVEPQTDAPATATSYPSAASEPAPNRTPLLAGVAFAVLVVIALYFVWRQGADASQQAAQAQAQLASIAQRTNALEARPAPAPPPDLRPLQQQIQTMAQRLDTLEKKPAPVAQLDQAGQQQVAALAGRVDGITARQNQLGMQEQSDVDQLKKQQQDDLAQIKQQLAALDSRLAAAEKTATQINVIDARDARLAQVQAALAALDAGRPLGKIDGAPPALAQYETKAPPTEASLRLSFNQYANAARQAGQPAQVANAPFLTRLWDRAQSGVVVREGDRVILGDAVSGVLDHAKLLLDAGDLAGAVKTLDGLAGPAAQAMAPWRAQAQGLLDARTSLIAAAHS